MSKYELAVIGVSLGGLQALSIILKNLPKDLGIAIAIAQHRPISSNGELVKVLQTQSLLPVIEPYDKQAIAPARVYLAPADYHLLVEPNHFALSIDPPVCFARPSIDVLFETAADAYRERLIGIILTGASNDGAQGLAKIQVYSGLTIVQEPTTAMSRIMPDAAISAVPKAKIIPLDQIAPFLVGCVSAA
jgi:two-component system, chemotaxis family, protein-glutamate methylesterase/glutaminase